MKQKCLALDTTADYHRTVAMSASPSPFERPEPCSERVRLDNGSVNVVRAGVGRPLVYLHGGAGLGAWNPFYANLAERFDFLAPEHPGYGDSDDFPALIDMAGMAAHYAELFKRMGLERPILVGTSFGGWIAAEIASRMPAIEVLVLIAAVGLWIPEAPIADIFAMTPAETRAMVFHNPDAVARPPMSRDAQDVAQRSRTALARFARSPLLHDPQLEPRLRDVQARTCVVWPECDRIVPRAVAERFAERIPEAFLEVLPRCGHACHDERPEALADLVSRFAGMHVAWR